MNALSEVLHGRELLVNLTLRDLRSRYRRSALGWTWSLVNPLATMVIFSIVFRLILKVEIPPSERTGLQNFPLFLLTGLIFWTFFSTSVSGSMSVMLVNAGLIGKVYFPREVLVLSTIASALVTLLVELAVLAVVLMIAGNFVLVWLPVTLFYVVVFAVFTTGVGLMLSVVNVYFRDLEYVVGILLQLLFYAAPIVYPVSAVPRELSIAGVAVPFGFLYNVNPLVRFVQVFRDTLYDLTFPPLADTLFLVAVSIAVLAAGLSVFNRLEDRLVEEL